MKTPRLRDVSPLIEIKKCECCDAPAEFSIIIDYDINVQCSDVFTVCVIHTQMARKGQFDEFFDLYGREMLKKVGVPHPTWLMEKPLLRENTLN